MDRFRAFVLFLTVYAALSANLWVGSGGLVLGAENAEMVRNMAQAGEVAAQVLLGEMLLKGEGVEKDPGKAFGWFKAAAERGSVEAQRQLGHMYERGLGVARDPAAARRWFSLAADRGDVVSRYKVDGPLPCP